MNRRVLITGSRNWVDYRAIALALSIQMAGAEGLTVVHGGAPGADSLAGQWARRHPRCVEEVHPAEWDTLKCTTGCYHKPRYRKNGDEYCPVAGNRRNQKMVDLGADVCLAFPLGESRGTRDCMRRAEAAGIPVHNFGDEYLI